MASQSPCLSVLEVFCWVFFVFVFYNRSQLNIKESIAYCLIVLIILSHRSYIQGVDNDDYNAAVYRQHYY